MRIKFFVSFLTIAFLCLGCLCGCSSDKPEHVESYTIIIDDTVNVYVGRNNAILPSLVNGEGTVVDSRFDFTPSTENIGISYDGKITIHEIPTEDVTVLITERNTGTQKTIRLIFVVEQLSNVTTISDVNGKPVDAINGLKFGEDITLNVITNLGASVSIQPYCSIHATDEQGNIRTVFEPSFSNNQITLRAVGFGKGTLSIEIKNASEEKIYDLSIPFSINLQNDDLEHMLLLSNHTSALGQDDLKKITVIEIDDTIKEVSEFVLFEKLQTIVLKTGEPVWFDVFSSAYDYRVSVDQYQAYYGSTEWDALKERIIPFDQSMDERYVIYHSDKAETITYDLIDEAFALKTLLFDGYTNTGWKDATDKFMSDDLVKNSSESCIHLYAEWVANENRIVFNGNGATQGSMLEQRLSTNTYAALNQNQYVKEGYVFAGWSTSDQGAVEYNDGALFQMNADPEHQLFAIWLPCENTLAFNANGGEGVMPPIQTETGTSVQIPKNQFAKKGYTFAGWSTTPDGNVEFLDESNYEMGTSSNNTLYAVWSIETFSISYELNGGSTDNPTEYTVETDTFTLIAPTKVGYTFIGWIDSKSHGYKMYITIAEGSIGDLTFTAGWRPNKNGINFHANGGTGEMDAQFVLTDEKATLYQNTFEREGYTFAGWSTTPAGGVEYTDQSQYAMGSDASCTLYAVWTPEEYSISYHLAGGENSGNPTKYNIESDPITLMAPTRPGYIFAGWAGEGIAEPTKDVSITTGSIGNRIYTAVWAATLYFHANGGEGSMESQILITNSSENSIPQHRFVREGYMFDGWSTSSDGSIVYEKNGLFSCGEEAEYHLYAVWNEGTEGLCFSRAGDVYHVTEYVGDAKDIVVPGLYRGKPVVSIGKKVFENNTQISSVRVSETIATIGEGAFAGCSGLNRVILSGDLSRIEDEAFKDCTSLFDIAIGCDGVTIGENAFSGCPIRNAKISAAAISAIPKDDLMTVEITGGTSIASYAFKGCDSLISVTIPQGITSIGYSSFEGCNKLVEVINNSGLYIDKGWSNNGSIAYYAVCVHDGESRLVSKEDYLFVDDEQGNYYLMAYLGDETELVLPDDYNGKAYSIGRYAFHNCSGLTSITIPDSVTGIGESAFSHCTGLTSITIPDSVTSIGDCSFEKCTILASITIPNSVTSIGNYAFRDCINIKHATLPTFAISAIPKSNLNTVIITGGTSIKNYAFDGCTNLTNVTIGNSVTSIGHDSFRGCTRLIYNEYQNGCYLGNDTNQYLCFIKAKSEDITRIEFNSDTKLIYPYAFYGCDTLTGVNLPESLISIGSYAFSFCVNLTTITLPESLTSIGNHAFDCCYKLVEVYNLSDLDITKGSQNHGDIGYYAIGIHTDMSTASKVKETGDYRFYVDGEEIYLLGYDGSGTEITLPDGYKGKNYSIYRYAFWDCDNITGVTIPDSVTSIGACAFFDCTSLTNVTIPDSVTSIGYSAFADCTGLTNVTIPDSVTSIGSYTFADCTSLTNVTIPNSVRSIGDDAFAGCTSLTDVTIGNSVTSIGDFAFYRCPSLNAVYITDIAKWCTISFYGWYSNPLVFARNLYVNNRLVTNLIIPDGVTNIGDYAFADCTSLTNITIPDSITSIGSYAFADCTSLTDVTIGNSVTSIGGSAFSGCASLTNVTIPDSVTSIGLFAFNGCDNIKHATLPTFAIAAIPKSNLETVFIIGGTSIEDSAFKYCEHLTRVIIGDSVTSIGDDAFRECTFLHNVTIGNSVTSIGYDVFRGCPYLNAVYITDIAKWCTIDFYGWHSNPLVFARNLYVNNWLVTNLIIPDGVTNIGDYAFYDCTSLTNVTIPDSVTSIGFYAFSGCTSLTDVTIGNSVTSIGGSAFSGCASLTNVTIPDSVTSIGQFAFGSCSGLTNVTIGNSVTSIGQFAFSSCGGLTNVTIGNSVTSIGNFAFDGCDNIKHATLPTFAISAIPKSNLNTVVITGGTSIGINAFWNCTRLTDVTIGNSVTSIENGAFEYCTSLTNVTIGENVTSIGEYAFRGCGSLTEVTIPDSVTSIGRYAFSDCTGLMYVTFENTSGWNTMGALLSPFLDDKSSAAKMLVLYYSSIHWTRSDT